MKYIFLKRTTLGKLLSEKLNYEFADADDFHSEENKTMMRNKIPLGDAQRMPWLLSLREHLLQWQQNNQNGVLACSALKQSYRHILNLGESVTKFILLNIDQSEIEKRLGSEPRANHFLTDSISLLPSQFKTLETPNKETALELNSIGYVCKETSGDSSYFIYVIYSINDSDSLVCKLINEILF